MSVKGRIEKNKQIDSLLNKMQRLQAEREILDDVYNIRVTGYSKTLGFSSDFFMKSDTFPTIDSPAVAAFKAILLKEFDEQMKKFERRYEKLVCELKEDAAND